MFALQRVLEAEENGDGFHDDDDFELDTPKRKNRNRGKVSVYSDMHIYLCVWCKREQTFPRYTTWSIKCIVWQLISPAVELELHVKSFASSETFFKTILNSIKCKIKVLHSLLNIPTVCSSRTEDPLAEGQSPLTRTTRTNLSSVTVREKKTLYLPWFFSLHV